MIPPITAVATPHPAARSLGEFVQLGCGDDLPGVLDGRLGALGVDARLIARRFQFINALLERRITGPNYGRIYDHELVAAVQRIAGDGVGDTRWKVPGVLDWSTGVYNPCVDVTKDTTTLYASDRDVFLFLVDDLNPIEAGTLPDGSPSRRTTNGRPSACRTRLARRPRCGR